MSEPLTDAFIQATGKALLDMNKRIETLENDLIELYDEVKGRGQ